MAEQDLDALLARMPAIASAVNAFQSEEVQKEAFASLVAAFTGRHHADRVSPTPPSVAPETALGTTADKSSNAEPAAAQQKSGARRKPSGQGKTWKPVEIDLRPQGKQSFEDFAKEKNPRSNEDKYAAVVYYLEQILGLSGITMAHIGSVFRYFKEWREPTDVQAGLAMTSKRKGTINTSSYSDIKTTAVGRNFVEHDLPPKISNKP